MEALAAHSFPFPLSKPHVTYRGVPNDSEDGVNDGMLMLLAKYISSTPNFLVLEIGPRTGVSSRYLLSLPHAPQLRLISVDDWGTSEAYDTCRKSRKASSHSAISSTRRTVDNKRTHTSQTQHTYEFKAYVSNVWEHRKRVQVLRMDVRSALQLLYQHHIEPDLCYVHGVQSDCPDALTEILQDVRQAFHQVVVVCNGIICNPSFARSINRSVHALKIAATDMLTNSIALLPSKYCIQQKVSHIAYQEIRQATLPTVRSLYKLAVIVPFNRHVHSRVQLQRFVRHTHSFLQNADNSVFYKIFVVSQYEKYVPTNHGYLCNAGFLRAKSEGYNHFVFHDLLYLPNDAMLEFYLHDSEHPVSIGHYVSQHPTSFDWFTFGAVLFRTDVFELVNGFPSDNYGCCGWDYALWRRLQLHSLTLLVPPPSVAVMGFTAQLSTPHRSQEHERLHSSLVTTDDAVLDHWRMNGLNRTACILQSMHHCTRKKRAYTQTADEESLACEYNIAVVDYTYFITAAEDIKVELKKPVFTVPCQEQNKRIVFSKQTGVQPANAEDANKYVFYAPAVDRNIGGMAIDKHILKQIPRKIDLQKILNVYLYKRDFLKNKTATILSDRLWTHKPRHSFSAQTTINMKLYETLQNIKWSKNIKKGRALYFGRLTEHETVTNTFKRLGIKIIPTVVDVTVAESVESLIRSCVLPSSQKYELVYVSNVSLQFVKAPRTPHPQRVILNLLIGLLKVAVGGVVCYSVPNYLLLTTPQVIKILSYVLSNFSRCAAITPRINNSVQGMFQFICQGFQKELSKHEESQILSMIRDIVTKSTVKMHTDGLCIHPELLHFINRSRVRFINQVERIHLYYSLNSRDLNQFQRDIDNAQASV